MKYEALPDLDKAEAERRLASDDREVLSITAAALPSVDDTPWVRAQLERLAQHEDKWVCGNALLALAELVRHGRVPDAEIDALRRFVVEAGDGRDDVKGKLHDALSDIDHYLRHTR